MCGIYGIVNLREPVDADSLKRKRDLLYHRGPDDAGIWISPSRQVGLAHRRLSIIDLTSAGHQPMISQDRRCVIVFNGEVYNFQALRAELENFGYQFKGNSDTEVRWFLIRHGATSVSAALMVCLPWPFMIVAMITRHLPCFLPATEPGKNLFIISMKVIDSSSLLN